MGHLPAIAAVFVLLIIAAAIANGTWLMRKRGQPAWLAQLTSGHGRALGCIGLALASVLILCSGWLVVAVIQTLLRADGL